jgi:hypothetical protein
MTVHEIAQRLSADGDRNAIPRALRQLAAAWRIEHVPAPSTGRHASWCDGCGG